MSEDNPIVPAKYGKPGDTETKYGESFELRVDVPVEVTTLRRTSGNDYVPAGEGEREVREERTTLRRFPLSALFPFIQRALELGHDFELLYHADGRSDPRGAVPLHKREMMDVLRFVYSLEPPSPSRES